MPRIVYFVQKELLLLGRDLHGLLLLFLMPTVFILIMSLALQNQFAAQSAVKVNYYLVNQDGGETSEKFLQSLEELATFVRLPVAEQADVSGEDALREKVSRDEVKFLLILVEDFENRMEQQETVVRLEIAPGTEPALASLFEAQLRQKLGILYLQLTLAPLLDQMTQETMEESEGSDVLSAIDGGAESLLQTQSLFKGNADQQMPNSVQQNVPAWLLFAMFFIAIPLSTTLIEERRQRTLARLQTMAFPRYQMFIGKLIPYFFINLIQVCIMLLVGMYLVPLLGGERLILGDSYAGLALISSAASLAAVCYALFVAQAVRTTEQATIFAGVFNIIMAAIGGVMVPRFIMPAAMQDLSAISPMAWGLDGFLDVLLRGGTVMDVLPEAGRLVAFAMVLLGLSIIISSKRVEQ